MKEITLKVKDIKEHIVNGIGPIMAKEGFEYKKTANEYFCKKGDNTYTLNMLLTAWSSFYSISLSLYISQKQIEDVLEEILGKQWHRLTCHQDMFERIYYSPDGRKNGRGTSLSINLVKNEDINFAIDVLEEFYRKTAKPYFDLFNNLEVFDDYINNPPFDYSPAYVGSYTNARCMKGLIVAKLVNNPNYKQLVSTYDEVIKRTLSDVQPDSITNYNRVKEYLQANF